MVTQIRKFIGIHIQRNLNYQNLKKIDYQIVFSISIGQLSLVKTQVGYSPFVSLNDVVTDVPNTLTIRMNSLKHEMSEC